MFHEARRKRMAKSEGSENEFSNEDSAYKLLAIIGNSSRPRSVKEAALRRLREIERVTGKDYYGAYNGGGPKNPSEAQRILEEAEEKA
jgi:hypothetical protein